LLEVRNLECARGDRTLFSDLSFSLHAGQLLHIVGSNGCGKTTLLRTVCGLTQPQAGHILWQDTDIDELREDYYQQLAHIGHLNGINGELSALENLSFHANIWTGRRHHNYDNILQQFGLSRVARLPTKLLSQGQKRRVALARLLTSSAPLWVLDEPLTALDVATVDFIHERLNEHINNDGLVIMTSHQALLFEVDIIQTIELN